MESVFDAQKYFFLQQEDGSIRRYSNLKYDVGRTFGSNDCSTITRRVC